MRKQFLLLFFVGLTQTIFSQTDSLQVASVDEYSTGKEAGAFIFNGREHVSYHPSIEGTPYYLTSNWQKGTIVFEGVPYNNVFLQYDLVADEVIIRHHNGFTSVVLFTPRVQSFTLGDKIFINLPNLEGSVLKTGIYERLSEGKLTLFAKRSKRLNETIISNSMERSFIENHTYYVLKEGKYYPIRKQKEIMELIPDKKKELNTWLKASGIRYKTDPESALIQIVAYYNQLSL